jgi:predicted alpha/beta superfamily hydrolase
VRKLIVSFVLLCLANTAWTQVEKTTSVPFCIGETHTIKSAVLKEDRMLNVYLPATFDASKTYPVLYLLDGSAKEDFLHIVGLFQFFNLQFQLPEFIIVGIENVDRKRDFTFPTKDSTMKKELPTSGGSEKFIQFLETEVKIYVEQHFKTSGINYLIGQSLGGLLATEILLKKPNLFTHYLIVSPSLWWDNQSLLKQAPSLLEKQSTNVPYVYVSVGGKEHPVMRKDAKKIYKLLKSSAKITKLDFLELPKETHASILHQSINEALKIIELK